MRRPPDSRLMAIMLGLGFASGLPLYLSGLTLSQWLTESGVATAGIGMIAWLGLPYTIKFLWGPLLDQVAPPFGLRRFGRRRGWLLVVQPPLAVAVVVLAWSEPTVRPLVTVLAALSIALFSATQDIAIDAWRIETFPPDRQGWANAVYVWGYRLAMFCAFSGVLWLVPVFSWHGALLAVACVVGASVVLTVFMPEPPLPAIVVRKDRWAAVAASLTDLLSRRGAILALGYVALFNLGEALAGALLTKFYAHLGFDRSVVAKALGVFPLFATMAGIGCGGLVVARLGLARAMIATGFLQMAAMALYIVLAVTASLNLLYLNSVTELFVQGMATAAFLAFMSTLCRPAYAATQFALLTSLAPLAARTVGGFSGFLQPQVGWPAFYTIAMLGSLPAMVLMLILLRQDQRLRQT